MIEDTQKTLDAIRATAEKRGWPESLRVMYENVATCEGELREARNHNSQLPLDHPEKAKAFMDVGRKHRRCADAYLKLASDVAFTQGIRKRR